MLFCVSAFSDSYELMEHLKNHFSEVNMISNFDDLLIKWKCKICEINFGDKETFKEHFKTHEKSTTKLLEELPLGNAQIRHKSNKNTLFCDICSKSFRSRKRLEFHIEFHLKGSKAGQCHICKKEFLSEIYLYNHMLHNHLNKRIFSCEICQKGFKNKSSLTYHSRSHKSFEAMKPFSCTICDKRFVRKNILRDHMMSRHGAGTDPRRTTCFQCRVCKEIFPNTDSGISHMEVHHPDQVDDKAGYSFNMQTVNKLFVCEFCDKCYSLSTDLIEHRLLHNSPLQYQCKMCNEEFQSFIEMRSHLDEHSADGMIEYKTKFEVPTLFICEFCEKCFKCFHAFSTHSNTHLGDKTYTCRFCSKVFGTYNDIKNHRLTHQNFENDYPLLTNELRPFECTHCKKAFTSNSSLTKHIRIHTGEKPFQCHVCCKSFTQSSGLYTHFKVHSNDRPYQCDLCSKSFKIIGDYKQHVRRHSGLRPFTCRICSKSFASQRTLKQHNKTH